MGFSWDNHPFERKIPPDLTPRSRPAISSHLGNGNQEGSGHLDSADKRRTNGEQQSK